jgi:WD40 repeat protein
MVSAATTLENDDPLTSAKVLSELDDSYQSDRALALLRRVADELPVAVLQGVDPKFSADGSRFLTFPNDGKTVLLWNVDALDKPLVLTGHGTSVIDAAIDGQGRRVAIACDDHTVTIWDVDGAREVAVINGYAPTYAVMERDSIALSGDGTHVAFLNGKAAEIASTTGQAKPVDLAGHTDAVLSIAYSPDGQRVATTSLDRTTRVWNAVGGQAEVFRIASSHPVHVELSADGSRVLTVDDNGTVRVWRTGTGGSPTVFNALDYTPYCATLRSDGRWLVAGTKEGAVLVWNVDTPQKPSVFRGPAWVRSASFTPEGTRIITASDDGRARIWSFNSDRPVVIKVHHGLLDNAIFDARHGRLFTSGIGENTQVWSPDGTEAETLVLKGSEGHVISIDFSPDGKRVVTGSQNGTVRVWSPTGDSQALVLRGHSAEVWTAAFSRDGHHILSVSRDGTARVWNADGRGESVVLRDEAGPVTGAAFSDDGTRVVTTAGPARIWSIDGQPGAAIFGDKQNPARRAEFSPDGTRVVMVAKKSAFVCNADGRGSPVELRVDDPDGVVGARFSPDGTRIVGWAGTTATIWHADGSGQPLVLPINSRVGDARFSPNGKSVLVTGFAFGAYLFRADGQGAPLFLEEPDGGRLSDAIFSADGKHVIASTSLHTVMVWKTDGPSTPLVLAGHNEMIQGLAVNPVAPMIGTASWDGTARLWSIDWQELMKYVRTRANHSGVCLNADQRIQYLGEEAEQAQVHYQECQSELGRRH